MKNKLEYRIENGSLIIDNYFNDLKIGSINGGRIENILNKCKLYDEEYETFLKENEYMKHIAKDFEQLQQENKQLKEGIGKAMSILKDNFVYDYVRSCDTADGVGYDEIDTEHFTYKVYEILKEVSK